MYACHVIFMRERFVIERLAVEPNLLIWFKKYRSPLSTLSPSPAGQWWISENFARIWQFLWPSYDDQNPLWRWKDCDDDVGEMMTIFPFLSDRLIDAKKKDQSSKVRFPHSEIDQNLISRSLGGAGGQKRSVHFGRNTETQSRNTRNTPKYPSRSSGSF